MKRRAAFKRLIFFFCISLVFLLLVILLQTFFGKYGNKAWSAWLWLVVHTLPVALIVLYTFSWSKLRSEATAQKDVSLYRIVYYGPAIYMVTVVLLLLLQPFANMEASVTDNLHATDTGLYVFQLCIILLLAGFIYKSKKNLVTNGIGEQPDLQNTVFISYNHSNQAMAVLLAAMLKKEGLDVLIDTENPLAGQEITAFIEHSVLNSGTTLAVISNESLLSGWVSVETINTFYLEKFSPYKRFIAVYLDADFFDNGFGTTAIRKINERLVLIENQIQERSLLGTDSRELNTEKTRLIELRNNMDKILDRLRKSLCIDIRNERLKDNFPNLLKSIKNVS